MANGRYESTGRLGRPFGGVEEVQDPYAINTPMAQVDPRSNPYGQGGGLRGRLRDALLAGGSAGHNKNRMAPVMNARMFDRGMAPEQQNYMAEQRAQQEYQQQQQDRVDGKKNKVSAYTDYLKNTMARGETGQMSMRSWLSMSDADRSQIIAMPTNNGYETVKNSGMFTGTQSDWNALGQADKSEILRSATRGSTGNPYSTVVKAGRFSGTQFDFDALSKTDQSKLLMESTAANNVNQGNMTRDEIIKEYTLGDYTPDSVSDALKYNDQMLLVEKTRMSGLSEEQVSREIAAQKDYMKDLEPIREKQRSYGDLITALNANSGAGDTAAIFKFMKTLDPNSTVREGEFALAAQAAGKFDEWSNVFNRLEEGKLLTPNGRQLIADLSKQIVLNTRAQRDSFRENYLYRVTRHKLDQELVMGKSVYDYENLPTYQMPDVVEPQRKPGSMGKLYDDMNTWIEETGETIYRGAVE